MADRRGLRARVYDLLEGDPRRHRAAGWIRIFLVLLIATNVAAVIIESEPAANGRFEHLFRSFEWISVAIFSVEYVLRIWTSVESPQYGRLGAVEGRLRYAMSPLAIVDLLAIAPAFLGAFVEVDLRELRAFRLLRLLKLGHFSPSIALYVKVLRQQVPAMLGAVLVMFVLMIVSASFMHVVEREAQPEAFGSVPRAIWWAVVTLTTVGYGDITPITLAGKMLAAVVMLLGVGAVAVPAGLLAGRFAAELEAQRRGVEDLAGHALEDGRVDRMERAELDAEGAQAGLSREDVQQIIEGALDSYRRGETCPRCGHLLPRRGEPGPG